MSFRQFPAVADNGENHIIIEFRDIYDLGEAATPRYELDDGRQLLRHGHQYTTEDGELRLRAS